MQVFLPEKQKYKQTLTKNTAPCPGFITLQSAVNYYGAIWSNIDIYYPPLLKRMLLYQLRLTLYCDVALESTLEHV